MLDTHFGNYQKSVHHDSETGVHHAPKWVSIILRNRCPSSAEIRTTNPLYDKSALRKLETHIHHMQLEVTENCNLRCKYCILSDLYPSEKNYSTMCMSWDTAKKAIDYLKSHSSKSKEILLSFYGGEPLLQYKLIKRTVSYAKRIFKGTKTSFSMTTNGTLLNKEICDFFIRENFRVVISLDGPKFKHDKFRIYQNGRGTFNDVMSGLKLFKALDEKYFKKNVQFNSVKTTPYAFDEIMKFFTKAISVDGNRVIHSFIREENTKYYDKYPETTADRRSYLDLISKYFIEMERGGNSGLIDFYRIKFLQHPFLTIDTRPRKNIFEASGGLTGQCFPAVKKLFVSASGDFHLCERVEHTAPIGNVDMGIDMDKVHNLLDPYYEDASVSCTKCWAMRLCNLCISRTMKNGTFCKENKRRNCKFHRKIMKKYLVRYCSILEKNPKAFDYMDKIKMT